MKNDPSKTKTSLSDNKNEEACDWHINSPDHYNCFWVYVYSVSKIDGSMPELVQSEIAKLLGWSNTKTHFMLKQAMAEVVNALNEHKANQLTGSDHEQIVDVPDFEPPTKYGSEDSEE